MTIIGIESLVYGVDDLALSSRFFQDFGLVLGDSPAGEAVRFRLPEGSSVVLRRHDDPDLPASALTEPGIREVIWGVESDDSRDALADTLARTLSVRRDGDGTAHFVTDFGVAMGLRTFARKPVVTAPDPLNAPGHVRRINQHRKWRQRAWPKVINHVVFAVPDHEAGSAFMQERLNFRLSDRQRGFGMYLRADGSNNHHTLLLLNASAPIPGMDGKARFHHANFGVEDIDEIMIGANHMVRRGWEPSHDGLGRHRIDSALFYYLPCPAGGEAEYGADADYVDDGWVPRDFTEPLFAYSHFVHNLPPFLMNPPRWTFDYLTSPVEVTAPRPEGSH